MEGFATGFAPARATKPGFVVENEKFRVTFDGVSILDSLLCMNSPCSAR